MKQIGAKNKIKRIGNQEFNSDKIFDTGRTKQETLKLLINFTKNECEKAWMHEDARLVAMKREFLNELHDALRTKNLNR